MILKLFLSLLGLIFSPIIITLATIIVPVVIVILIILNIFGGMSWFAQQAGSQVMDIIPNIYIITAFIFQKIIGIITRLASKHT